MITAIKKDRRVYLYRFQIKDELKRIGTVLLAGIYLIIEFISEIAGPGALLGLGSGAILAAFLLPFYLLFSLITGLKLPERLCASIGDVYLLFLLGSGSFIFLTCLIFGIPHFDGDFYNVFWIRRKPWKVLPIEPFEEFFNKFARKRIPNPGWKIDEKFFKEAERFYTENPEEFKRATKLAETKEEFRILAGIR